MHSNLAGSVGRLGLSERRETKNEIKTIFNLPCYSLELNLNKMEHEDNIAGLGKNHDAEAHDHDIAKKQSEAKPAAENLDMMPNSRNADGSKGFLASEKPDGSQDAEIHKDAADYAKEEHEKADNWEDHSTKKDQP